jgi:two-component system OmpR family sensor kinase/two-component system sensor histidine kinase BaeS
MNRLWVRLTFAFIAVILVAVAVIAAFVNANADTEFRQYLMRQDMVTMMQAGLLDDLAAFYQRNGNWNGVSNIIANYSGPMMMRGRGQGRNGPPLVLADANGNIVYDERNLRVGTVLTADERNIAQKIIVGNTVAGYLLAGQAGRSALAPTDQAFLDQLRWTLVIAGIGAIGLGIVLGLVISRTLSAPLSNLAHAARAFAGRNWNVRVKVQGADEIAEVAREFNAMAEEIQRAETLRRNLMADIAHELRTPLTVLQGNLSAMLDGVYPLERSEIATLYDETRALNRLVDDLRELALADAGQLQLNQQSIDVAEIARNVAASFAGVAEAHQIELQVHADTPILTHADPDRLAQILRNLIANALRHTPSGGKISIQCSMVNPQVVQVAVTDSGEGIAPEELPRVFERFYRGDKSRARTSGGTGLGLAIAKAWVEALGGTIGVESEPGRGSHFWFTLPAAQKIAS